MVASVAGAKGSHRGAEPPFGFPVRAKLMRALLIFSPRANPSSVAPVMFALLRTLLKKNGISELWQAWKLPSIVGTS